MAEITAHLYSLMTRFDVNIVKHLLKYDKYLNNINKFEDIVNENYQVAL